MQNPFFRRQYINPTPRPYDAADARRSSRGIPVQRPPKVVSIPVHFIDSEISRCTAAKRIQKVFRGFLVRRNVKKIAGTKKQVDEMEANLSLLEKVDLIRKDSKERLKVNETLMSLLLRLDSVRSFDSGVRDLRKSVIKKVIVLQERLDAIIFRGEDLVVQEDQIEEVNDVDVDVVDDPIEEIKYPIEAIENQIEEEGEKEESCDLAEQEEDLKAEEEEETVKEATKEETIAANGGMEMEQQPDLIQGKCDNVVEKVGGDERKKVMERMMEKNDILIGMVKELCEKNKMQTEIINSLSKRVDSLEKAFKRSKSKKRKQITAAGTDVNHHKKF